MVLSATQTEPNPDGFGSEPDSEPNLTAAAAARLAGVSDTAIRKALESGRLQGERTAEGWRIPLASVEAYMADRTNRPNQANRTEPNPEPGSETGSEPGSEPAATVTVPLEVFQALLERHEAAMVRLGQLETEKERLQITAGGQAEALEHAQTRIAELEALASKSVPAPAEAPASTDRRRWWWPWSRTTA